MRRGQFLLLVAFPLAVVCCARDKSPLAPGEKPVGCAQRHIPWPSLANSPWPIVHGDVQCTGRGRYPGPKKGEIEWVFNIGRGSVNGSPVIGEDGTIYLVTNWQLYAVNPDGSLKWEFTRGFISNGSVVVGAGDVIYFATGTTYREPGVWGYLYALDNGGNLLWEYRASGMFFGLSPAIGLDGTIYLTDTEGYLHAVDGAGTQRWKVRGESGFRCQWWNSIAISPDGRALYLPGLDSTMCAVEAASGSVLWEIKVGCDVDAAALVDNQGNVYLYGKSNHDSYILSLTQEGSVRWKCDIPEVKRLHDTVDMHMDRDGNIYFCDSSYLYSIDCQGRLRSKVPYPPRGEWPGYTAIIGDSQGNVFVFMMDLYFYCFTAEGQLSFECYAGRATGMWGALSDGRLYVTAGAQLLCIR